MENQTCSAFSVQSSVNLIDKSNICHQIRFKWNTQFVKRRFFQLELGSAVLGCKRGEDQTHQEGEEDTGMVGLPGTGEDCHHGKLVVKAATMQSDRVRGSSR